MASTQEIIYTHRGKLDTLQLNVSKRIVLSQEPPELVTLSFDSKCVSIPNRSSNFVHIEHVCDLGLKFHNQLHEVSSDYGYEINFYIYVEHDSDTLIPLFSHRELRKSSDITLLNKHFLTELSYCKPVDEFREALLSEENRDKYRICCSIHRFNARVADRASSDATSDKTISSMLLNTGHYSDLCLLVGQRKFKAHKHVLALKSPVFRAMFTHEMTENQSGLVKIDDLDVDVVEELLAFIYTGKVNFSTFAVALGLYEASDKYNIEDLRLKCKEHILFSLTYHNVADVVQTADFYDDEDLSKKVTAFVNLNERKVALESSYQDYLCNSLANDTVVRALKLSVKYHLADVKSKAMEFVKRNNKDLAKRGKFLDLIESHPKLMREIYAFVHQ